MELNHYSLLINNLRTRSKELEEALERTKQLHEQRREPLIKVLLQDIAADAVNMTSELRALWGDASDSITELQNVCKRIFDILRQQTLHNESILKLVEDMNTVLENEHARLQIFEKYRDWVGDLRDHLTSALNDALGRNSSWGEIARDIRRERMLKTEAVRRGRDYQCPVSDALKESLEIHSMTMDELEAIFQMKNDGNALFHRRAENETCRQAINFLDAIKFPPNLGHLKEPLRKTIQAVEVFNQREIEHEFGAG